MIKSIETIMSEGGDHRITLSEQTGLNKYGCSPYPSIILNYGSTTANTISLDAFKFVKMLYLNKLAQFNSKIDYENYYEIEIQSIKKEIKDYFDLNKQTEVILGASGTDLELLIINIGISSKEGQILNIILSPSEVGSGIKDAACGDHFSSKTALSTNNFLIGDSVDKEQDEKIETVFIESRDVNSELYSDEILLKKIENEIQNGLKNNKRVVLHTIYRSKTGAIIPSKSSTIYLLEKYKGKIDISIDCCQGRVSNDTIHDFISRNAMILYTGSKFVGGPPFSGALIIPQSLKDRVTKNNKISHELVNYFSKEELPNEWTINNLLFNKKNNQNLGLLYRWKSANYEMRRFSQISEQKIIEILSIFNDSLINEVSNSTFFTLLDKKRHIINDFKSALDFDMIYVLLIKSKKSDNCIDLAKKLKFFLGEDLLNTKSFNFSEQKLKYFDKVSLTTKINVGQPIGIYSDNLLSQSENIRLSLNMPEIFSISAMSKEEIYQKFNLDLKVFFHKCNLIYKLIKNNK